MKKYILLCLALVAATLSFSQVSPSSKERSNGSFTQVDQYLSVIKRLGIPTATSDNLEGQTSGPNAAKILYNTTLNKLRIYNPVTQTWKDATDVDLSNYYTKTEVDALISAEISDIEFPVSSVNAKIGTVVLSSDDIESKAIGLGVSTTDALTTLSASKISTNNVKTINGQSIVGTGDIQISGGATSLQELTTGVGNNVTDNALIVKGYSNRPLAPTDFGGYMYYDPTGKSFSIDNFNSLGVLSSIYLGNNRLFLSSGTGKPSITLTSSAIELRGGGSTIANLTGALSTFHTRVSGQSAINSNEFVTKAQLDAVKQSAKIHDNGTFVANTIGGVTTFIPTIAGVPTDNFEINIKKVDGVTHGIKYVAKKAGVHFVNYQSLRTAGHEQVIINSTKAVNDEVILDAIYYNDGSEATQMTFKHTDGKLYVLKIMILSGGSECHWSVEKW